MTYSRTNLSPVDALNQLNTKFPFSIEKYVISQEEHLDEPEKGKHLHVFLEFNTKTNISCARKLDLVEEKKCIHREYQPAKNIQNIITYVKKDGNYITNFESDVEFRIKLFELAKKEGI